MKYLVIGLILLGMLPVAHAEEIDKKVIYDAMIKAETKSGMLLSQLIDKNGPIAKKAQDLLKRGSDYDELMELHRASLMAAMILLMMEDRKAQEK